MVTSPDIFVAVGVTQGQKARLARIAQRLRQSDLAALAHVTQYQVSLLERDLFVPPKPRGRILMSLGLEASE